MSEDKAQEAIDHMEKAETALDESDLPNAEKLSNLVAFVRGFVEADVNGLLEQLAEADLFDV